MLDNELPRGNLALASFSDEYEAFHKADLPPQSVLSERRFDDQ